MTWSPTPTDAAALLVPTETPTPTLTSTPLPSFTSTSTLTITPSATSSATETPTPTSSPVAAAVGAATSEPPTPIPVVVVPADAPEIPPEVVVGVGLLVLVVGYVALYWRGLAAGDRYADGFVIERCPVCQRGHLTVEMRPARVLGIPRPQAIVRCDNCRSVLREVGSHRWRYAVDPAVSPTLFNQLNGRVVSEEALRRLEEQAPSEAPPVRPPVRPPTFVDDEE